MEEVMKNRKQKIYNTFAALKHRNYRLFWFGQCISLIGTWMQNIAQSWLVLEVTKSAFWLGVVSAMQFLPMLIFSLYAGTLVDRFPKKRVLLFTQTCLMMLALILAVDTWLHTVALWHVIVLAGLLGFINTLDMPTRQSFMVELVGEKDLMNAIVLNSSIFNAARVVGPSIAGVAIAKLGIASCFFLNSVSFIPVIIGIVLINIEGKVQRVKAKTDSVLRDIKDGLGYVVKTKSVLLPLIILAIINIFAMNFNVIIPLLTKNVFGGDAQSFGILMSATGIGALIGSLILASKSDAGPKMKVLVASGLTMCVLELLVAPVKNFLLMFILLAFVGISMITFTTNTNSMIQTQTPDYLRGRVMSIYGLVFGGLTPLGSFITGTLANSFNAPVALGVCASISIVLLIIVLGGYSISKKVYNA